MFESNDNKRNGPGPLTRLAAAVHDLKILSSANEGEDCGRLLSDEEIDALVQHARQQPNKGRFEFGDILRTDVDDSHPIPIHHYGVYVGQIDHVELVFELKRPKRSDVAVCWCVRLEHFENGEFEIEPDVSSKDSPEEIGQRMKELTALARQSQLLYRVVGERDGGWNCEEVARYVAYGVRESFQAIHEEATHEKQKEGMEYCGASCGCCGTTVLAIAGVAALGTIYVGYKAVKGLSSLFGATDQFKKTQLGQDKPKRIGRVDLTPEES